MHRGPARVAQLGPGPGWHAAAHLLAAPLCRFVAQRDAIVRLGDFDESGVRCQVSEGAQELIRARREIRPTLMSGTISQSSGSVASSAASAYEMPPIPARRPARDRGHESCPTPSTRPRKSLQRNPQCFWMKTPRRRIPGGSGKNPRHDLARFPRRLERSPLDSLRNG